MIASRNDTAATIAAVVNSADGVRFVATGRDTNEIVTALAEYVRERCDDVLWPLEARHVGALIDARQPGAAIAAYFEHVGSRWDEEWLEIHRRETSAERRSA